MFGRNSVDLVVEVLAILEHFKDSSGETFSSELRVKQVGQSLDGLSEFTVRLDRDQAERCINAFLVGMPVMISLRYERPKPPPPPPFSD